MTPAVEHARVRSPRCAILEDMSRSQERVEFQALCAAVAEVPWTDPDAGAAGWSAALRARAPDEGTALAKTLLRAYRHGALSPERWQQLTGRPPASPREIDEAIRLAWDAFVAAGLVPPHTVDPANRTPAMIRRWAWQPRWYLSPDDEDLLLMEDALVPVLLEIAGEREAPKRSYLLGIVAHHARDSCCHAVWWARDIEATLGRVAAWAPLARAAGDAALAVYLERLGSYAARAPVDRDGALARLVDLARCSPPEPDKVQLRELAGAWEGALLHSGGNRRIRIDASTGALTHPPKPAPRRRR